MPNMADITVKKADGTTDVTYSKLTPSAGDTTPARWAVLGTSVPAHRTVAEMRSRFNGNRDARNCELRLKMPDLVTVSGIETIQGNCIIGISGTLPLQVTQATIDEAVAQAANLFKAALIQESFKVGYSPQ